MSKGVQIAVGALLVAGLLGWYGWTTLRDAGTYRYYQTLSEFRDAAEPGPARVHGYVAVGSIRRDLASKSVRFSVRETPPHAGGEADAVLEVRYASLETPDLFKDGAEVVVEGELAAGEPLFHATKVLAKCPSKFEAEATRQASF